MFSIGEASRHSGVKIETIRYYEREGVVPEPGRSASGWRLYTTEQVGRLRFVKRCRELGFPIPIIQTLLSLTAQDGRSCGDVKSLAQDHLAEINMKIENLERLKTALVNLAKNCDEGSAACPMLDALLSDDWQDGW